MSKEFGDSYIESAHNGYRPRQPDEVGLFRIKELMRDLRDDGLTVITTREDKAAAQRLKQRLGAAKYTPPEFW